MSARLYRSLYRIRRLEEEIARVYPTDKIKSPVHLSIGQEAVSVGVCEALRPRGRRLTAPTAATPSTSPRAATCSAMVAELYGQATGCTRRQGRLDAPDRPGSGHDGHVRRRRHHHRQRGRPRLRPALPPAGRDRRQLLRRRRHRGRRLRREPQLRGSEASAAPLRLREQPLRHPHAPEPPAGAAGHLRPRRAYGMPAERIDGNDVLGLLERTREAAAHVRAGEGPVVPRSDDLPLARARRPRQRLPPRLPHGGGGRAVDGGRPGAPAGRSDRRRGAARGSRRKWTTKSRTPSPSRRPVPFPEAGGTAPATSSRRN